jgi:F0F1-type ATP synthase membrane subunit b/b'
MEQTLTDLGGLLIRALPTFLLVVALHFYLKFMFFKPMERVMRARHDASEGARKAAGESAEKAERMAAEFEKSMRAVRASLFAEQDARRKQTRAEQAAAIMAARKQAQGLVRRTQQDLAQEVEQAKGSIERESESLAAQITAAILRGRTA